MDFEKVHNPYDFANPVSDIDLFVGRANELQEINYYLDHAKNAPNPINIAIIGARASGKTSLLNICQYEADKRGFITVRIDLDESDSNNQLNLFYKLFDHIFSAACENGGFGGKCRETYDTYLDIVNSFDIPKDKMFCPFIFPIQYAKAFNANLYNANLSDHNFKNDLVIIQKEVNRPIILLFDECNVLKENKIILQKLRNIFMNNPGYMLVFTGTQSFFPILDEVFSPIIRQFKKIYLKQFTDEDDTRECINKPLNKCGINPDEIFDFETFRDVKDIHDISGGWPYEIQLICHILFRRLQEKRATKMKLDLSVLEEVKRELEAAQNIYERPIISKVIKMNNRQLKALNIFFQGIGNATFEQMWTIYSVFATELIFNKDELKCELDWFVKENILSISESDIITFIGDQFDSIYIKYYAREKKVSLNFVELPMKQIWRLNIFDYFIKSSSDGIKPPYIFSTEIDFDMTGTIEKLELDSVDMFTDSKLSGLNLYKMMVKSRSKEKIQLLSLKIVLPWLSQMVWVYETSSDKLNDSIIESANTLKARIKTVNGDSEVDIHNLKVLPLTSLMKRVTSTSNEYIKDRIYKWHNQSMVIQYLHAKNKEETKVHADLAFKYVPEPNDYATANNMGYIFISIGLYGRAKKLLSIAIEKAKEPRDSALSHYNMGLVEAKKENIIGAIEHIKLCIDILRDLDKQDLYYACLFEIFIKDKKIKMREILDNPVLYDIAMTSLKELKSYTK